MKKKTPKAEILVTLEYEGPPDATLEERIDAISEAFRVMVRASQLEKILEWDINHGRARFVMGEQPAVGERVSERVRARIEHFDRTKALEDQS